jgi:serine/threonine-protein kinase
MIERPSWIGKTLGDRYRIEELLGQGGMSAVYKAFDPNLKRVVAIKIIHSHLADDSRFISRFEEEAKAVAQLRHANIVQVYDFNHEDDVYYMVQEFIPGETLQQRLKRLRETGRTLGVNEAVQYIVQVAQAAGYAHQRGMVHRDIKPANIMIDVHDQAVLMDFGIVKIAGGEQHTATGAVVGTALYLPPELVRGEVPDPRSDIYSLAVTLFETLSGKPPFEADSAMTLLMMHLNDPVPDLRTLRPDATPALGRVIEKAMAKRRESRYQSMDEFTAALKTTLDSGATFVELPITEATVIDDLQETAAEPGLGALVKSQAPLITEAPSGQDLGVMQAASPGSKKRVPLVAWIAAGLAAIVLVALGIYALTRPHASPNLPAVLPTATSDLAETTAAPENELSPTETQQPTATQTPAPTETPEPTPTLGLPPTATFPAGVPFVFIKAIELDNAGNYIVDYDTLEYVEELPGEHVHFFFNTVPPEDAGRPADGPWYVWGGPRPFNRFRQVDRPDEATQMCALVANPNHGVQLESGTCLILPDVNAVTVLTDTVCLAGPSQDYPVVTELPVGEIARVLGISPDETHWNVQNPLDIKTDCWLPHDLTYFQGDLSSLPLVEAPSLGEATNPEGLRVEIQNINLDSAGRYVVEYQTTGFTEQLPGTHMHFFFDNVSPDEVGIEGAGDRRMFGGPSPFTGYTQAERPADASRMCVLVANPDHSIIPNSGNCFTLP